MMVNKEKNFISSVIYVHNNEHCIENFIQLIYSTLSTSFENFEIICVDDGSKDRSVSIIEEIAKNFDNVIVNIVLMGRYHGLDIAMKAGLDLAIGDFVYEFDNPEIELSSCIITEAYFTSLKGYDIVNCCTNSKGRVTSNLFYRTFNRFSKISHDIHSEIFRLLSRRAINRVYSMNVSTVFRKAIYANCGLKIKNIFFDIKHMGNLKDDRTSTAINALLLFTNIGYKISVLFTSFMAFFSVMVLMYTTYIYLTGNPVTGWTPIMLFSSFSFLGLFIIITILIKYVDLLLLLTFKKQEYHIENVFKVQKNVDKEV